MITVQTLREYGANVDEGLARCMGQESFYIGLVNSIIPDSKPQELKSQIEAGDLDKAFETAHALKGMYTNLSLTPIAEPIIELTELLRARTQTDYSELLEKFLTQKDKLDKLAAQ